MGGERTGRALTLCACALVALAPSIAMAKTLEGTRVGDDPVQGVVPGPPTTGTVAPMIVPPSTVAGAVSTSVPPDADADDQPETGEEPADERGPESGLPGIADDKAPTRNSPSTGGLPSAPVASGGQRNSGSTTTGITASAVEQRPAGPSIPLPPGMSPRPSALALREQTATASPAAPRTESRAAGPTRDPAGATVNLAGPTQALAGPTGDPTVASSPPTYVSTAGQAGTGSSVSCATLPSPGTSNERIAWTSVRTAEITAGRDLRSTARVGPLPGATVTWEPASPLDAYVLHPNTLAVMARFTAPALGPGGPVGLLDQPLPGLHVTECDGRPAAGIAPGTYLLRYAFTGTVASTESVASEPFVSPPVPVRVIAGPTAPTRSAPPKQ